MEVTVDKFGRVLIPKRIREKLGLFPGAKLDLLADEQDRTLKLSVDNESSARIEYRHGIPVIITGAVIPSSFDVKEFIREGYLEYLDSKLG